MKVTHNAEVLSVGTRVSSPKLLIAFLSYLMLCFNIITPSLRVAEIELYQFSTNETAVRRLNWNIYNTRAVCKVRGLILLL
jgi:hypothetical protein